MKTLWDDAAAGKAIAHWRGQGAGDDLALRTYSARLLGGDPRLVLHGGGNTSVKTTALDLFGDETPVLCVKGSGWDLATIEPAGHPAVRLAPLLRLRGLSALSDEAMVNAQRQNLMDSAAPNPSVETLLHAFIPEKFIDHTHAVAVLALANQPDAEAVIARLYGNRVACVPYVMPGFDLARLAADIYDSQPSIEGLVLIHHGLFSFGPTARQSYERMIDLVTVAENYLAGRRAKKSASAAAAPADKILPYLRGVLNRTGDGRRWILDRRSGNEVMRLVNDPRLSEWSERGVATPDHVIRTKRYPLVLTAPRAPLNVWALGASVMLERYMSDYAVMFERQNARVGGGKKMLDPLPRIVVAPGLGLVGIGRNASEAAVAADVAESWVQTLLAAEDAGRFAPLGEADTFDMEYWSLEQAKLGKVVERRLERHVVVVTGGGGAIGAATARAFAAEGAQVAVLDVDAASAEAAARAAGGGTLALACDVTDAASVDAAFAAVCERFGGADVVISNAGSATTGMMAQLSDAALRASFDLNFFAHQSVAQAAIRVFDAQGTGGALLFNVSKQALNPGENFGAYGAAKAALLALMRQYALEHGPDGIRVNALNPDRIRSGLLTPEMIASRAASRGLDEETYLAGNLLRREVTAEDVAQAFVFAALMRGTTGAVITVDGGNVSAMVR